MADHLSECILVQVLRRLPVKPLFRCTAVEKSWYRLIKSPYFKTLYSSYHQKNDKNKYLLFYAHNPPRFSLRHDDEQSKEYSPQLQFPIQEKRLQVYGISNGLICLSTRLDIQDLRKSIYLWNPVIRKSKTLPDSPLPSRDQLLQIQYCCSTAGLAFGYFANMDDYRVVLFVTYHSLEGDDSRPDLFFVYVYSLTTNSWKTIDSLSEVPCYKISSSVVINGSVYWLGEYCNLIAIVCFEVENEIIRNLKLPQYPRNQPKHVALAREFAELLSLFYFDTCTRIFHLWVLENENGEEVWIKKVTLDLNEINGRWWPLGFRNNGEIVLENAKECGFLSYDLEEGEKTEIVEDAVLELWSFRRAYFDPGDVAAKNHTDVHLPTYVNVFEESLVLLADE